MTKEHKALDMTKKDGIRCKRCGFKICTMGECQKFAPHHLPISQDLKCKVLE